MNTSMLPVGYVTFITRVNDVSVHIALQWSRFSASF